MVTDLVENTIKMKYDWTQLLCE